MAPIVTTGPGYAIFNDLRQKMGISSSQPVPTSSRDVNAGAGPSPSSPEPMSRFASPDMDDVAASQQLMDEGARAHPTYDATQQLPQSDAAHDKPASARKKRKKTKLKATQKAPEASFANTRDAASPPAIPSSSPFPFPATQPEAEEITGPVSGSLQMVPSTSQAWPVIDVPDSQVAAIPVRAPASPPKSSYTVPSSVTKTKRTYKKHRQLKRDEIAQDTIFGETVEQLADTNTGTEDPISPSHTTPQRKRPRTRDTDGGSPGAVDATPAPAKRRKIGTPKSATTLQDLIQSSPNDDADMQQTKKTKLKRVKKPHTPITKIKDIYDIPDGETEPTNGAGVALASSANNGFGQSGNGEEGDQVQVASTRKKRSEKKKKTTTNGDVYDWHASVRQPGQLPNALLNNKQDDDILMQDPISTDDEDPPYVPAEEEGNENAQKKKSKEKGLEKEKERKEKKKRGRKKKQKEESVAGPSVMKIRRNNGSSISELSSAERALNASRDLGHPPDLRTNGDFTEDEEELIRRAIIDFQQRKGLDVSELVEIIQWNQYDPRFHRDPGVNRNKSDWTPQDREDERESTEFWDEIKSIGMTRSHDRLRRHIRQLYHQFKSGAWTEEEDQQLRNLQAAHPNQWKLISITMGDRSMHDCVNRWRDYLQYGEQRKTSRWTEDEENLLIRAVTTVAQRDEDHRAETGRPPLDTYTNKHISWPQVAREMGNSRSRIQASVKWTQLMKRDNPPQIEIEYKPRASTAALTDAPTKKKRRQSRKQDAADKNAYRSQDIIVDSDVEERETPEEAEDRPELATSITTSKKRGQPEELSDESQDRKPEEDLGADKRSAFSPPPEKEKRGRTRESEATEADKPKEVDEPSMVRDASADREAEEEHVSGEVSDSHSKKKKKEKEKRKKKKKKRSRKSEIEEVDEAEEGQREKEDVGASCEEDEHGSQQDEAEEAQVQEEQGEQVEEEPEEQVQEQVQEQEQEQTEADEESDGEAQVSEQGSAEARDESVVESAALSGEEAEDVSEPSAGPGGVDQMLWGDKYDLIFKLQDRRDDYEEEIDWEDVRKDQGYPWSTETLKAALHGLIRVIGERGREVDADDFPGTIDDVMDFISEEHGAELEEHYQAA
ncbi:hypothetical protein COCMIDRAFT_79609 [Bipolaris oryzae ATCC 44560]|uniref:Uncharacterized protein n=1 Tax=Bipolaris oryzae ATCC 44560 TaxID=930090 RepID=W7A5H9_COCMI|nr:uncharacterized protein COCMIDRAFT_79609 [Bipolaris oryzae ATCC 44560]EUC51396.1 hypothetical protein COCMIDRAFT_79609 [Bipolaris oryzae ATCC 44560]